MILSLHMPKATAAAEAARSMAWELGRSTGVWLAPFLFGFGNTMDHDGSTCGCIQCTGGSTYGKLEVNGWISWFFQVVLWYSCCRWGNFEFHLMRCKSFHISIVTIVVYLSHEVPGVVTTPANGTIQSGPLMHGGAQLSFLECRLTNLTGCLWCVAYLRWGLLASMRENALTLDLQFSYDSARPFHAIRYLCNLQVDFASHWFGIRQVWSLCILRPG